MINNLKQSVKIMKMRRKENNRKLTEKVSMKDNLTKIINKFDEALIDDHRKELE
jgi:hypothetical protein